MNTHEARPAVKQDKGGVEMDVASERKPYAPPRIARVVLRREQAILSQCSVSTANVTLSGDRLFCSPIRCRRDDDTSPDSAATPS